MRGAPGESAIEPSVAMGLGKVLERPRAFGIWISGVLGPSVHFIACLELQFCWELLESLEMWISFLFLSWRPTSRAYLLSIEWPSKMKAGCFWKENQWLDLKHAINCISMLWYSGSIDMNVCGGDIYCVMLITSTGRRKAEGSAGAVALCVDLPPCYIND